MQLSYMVKRVRTNIREPRENAVQDQEIIDWLNDFSFEYAKQLNYPYKFFTLHAIEEQADYDLPTDYIKLQPLLDVMFDERKLDKYGVKYLERKYPLYLQASGVEFPELYYVKGMQTISLYPPPKLQAEGTATAGATGSTLIDSSASFASSDIGNSIRNITDGSHGLVSAVASATECTVVLSDGTNNDWELGDEWKMNRSGIVPYVYKEDAMAEDDDENEIAKLFPYLLIYAVTPLADMVKYRTDSAAQLAKRMDRWDTLTLREFNYAKKIVNEEIRGQRERTISPYDRYSRRNYSG